MAARMPSDAHLTETERQVRHDVLQGLAVCLGPEDDVGNGGSWEADRAVRAEVLAELLTDVPTGAQRALRLRGARITGHLRLSAMVVQRPMVIEECWFDNPIELDDARVSIVTLRRCRLPAFFAAGVETWGDLEISRSFEINIINAEGARIGGFLNLTGTAVDNAGSLALDVSHAEIRRGLIGSLLNVAGEFSMMSAHVSGTVSLDGAALINPGGHALTADGMRAGQGMSLRRKGDRRFTAQGMVRLLGTRIGNNLSLTGASLSNPHDKALAADGMVVDQGVFLASDGVHRFEADGEVRLTDVDCGNLLTLQGAKVRNEHGPALDLARLRARQGVFCNQGATGHHTEVYGEFRLAGARIGGQLVLSSARLDGGPKGIALNGTSLSVSEIRADPSPGESPFKANGDIVLSDGVVNGSVAFNDSSITCGRSETALSLARTKMKALVLPRPDDVAGHIDLRNAQARQLIDGVSPEQRVPYDVFLTGFTYETLGGACDAPAPRLAWLRAARDDYVPHGFDQLAEVYRRGGRDADVRKVMIAKQRHHRSTLAWGPARVFSYILDGAVGYGYRTGRALMALFGMVAFGWLVFSLAWEDHMRALKPQGQLPQFSSLLYSIDAVLPVVTLGQETSWSPTGWAMGWYAFSVLGGWLLGLGLVAYVTATFFRE